ncbi:DUF3466 family protein [bacterium]|nr:MAG: DUF3466 family protein [bacterium]
MTGSRGYDINNDGTVTGTSVVAVDYAVVWGADGGVRSIGELYSGGYSTAHAINNLGSVVGNAQTSANQSHAFRALSGTAMTDLTPYPSASIAYDLNDNGWTVGNGSDLAFGGSVAFRYNGDGTYQRLGRFGTGRESTAYAINASGTVVGRSASAYVNGFNRDYLGFIWTESGGLQPLSKPEGAGNTWAYDINDAGTIVGRSDIGTAFEPVLWDASGRIRVLSRPANSSYGEANVINANGAVLGKLYNQASFDRPILWNPDGSLVELGGLGMDGWVIRDAVGMNDGGQIVGTAYRNGIARAYVLTPVPEPASLVALTLGGLALLRRRKRS